MLILSVKFQDFMTNGCRPRIKVINFLLLIIMKDKNNLRNTTKKLQKNDD